MSVSASPPSESASSLVSTESRYGTCSSPFGVRERASRGGGAPPRGRGRALVVGAERERGDHLAEREERAVDRAGLGRVGRLGLLEVLGAREVDERQLARERAAARAPRAARAAAGRGRVDAQPEREHGVRARRVAVELVRRVRARGRALRDERVQLVERARLDLAQARHAKRREPLAARAAGAAAALALLAHVQHGPLAVGPQQVVDLLGVHLEVRDEHAARVVGRAGRGGRGGRAHRVGAREEHVRRARHEPVVLVRGRTAQLVGRERAAARHRVRLSRAGRAVREHGRLQPRERRVDERLHAAVVEEVGLREAVVAAQVEAEGAHGRRRVVAHARRHHLERRRVRTRDDRRRGARGLARVERPHAHAHAHRRGLLHVAERPARESGYPPRLARSIMRGVSLPNESRTASVY